MPPPRYDLDEYYTGRDLSKHAVNLAIEAAGNQNVVFFEPGVGSGSLYHLLPQPKCGVELTRSAMGFDGVEIGDFLKFEEEPYANDFWRNRNPDGLPVVTIMNPPFGGSRGLKSLAVRFLHLAMRFSDSIIAILPLGLRRWTWVSRAPEGWRFDSEYIPPKCMCDFTTHEGVKNVNVSIQVWKRGDSVKVPIFTKTCDDFTILPRSLADEGNMAVRIWGSSRTIGNIIMRGPQLEKIREVRKKKERGNTSCVLLRADDPEHVARKFKERKRDFIAYCSNISNGNNPCISHGELITLYLNGYDFLAPQWPIHHINPQQ